MADERPVTFRVGTHMARLARQDSEGLAHCRERVVGVTLRGDEAVLIDREDDDVATPDEMLDPGAIGDRIDAEIAVEKDDHRSRGGAGRWVRKGERRARPRPAGRIF
jgi:hypothetical protein